MSNSLLLLSYYYNSSTLQNWDHISCRSTDTLFREFLNHVASRVWPKMCNWNGAQVALPLPDLALALPGVALTICSFESSPTHNIRNPPI